MKTLEEPITIVQIKKIWFESKQFGLLDEDLHKVIESHFGVSSLKKLSKKQAIILIDKLVECTGNSKHRPGMATPMQLWKIEELHKKLGWNTEGLKGFVKKYAHVDNLNWLTDSTASAVINGLENIYKAQEK